LYLDTIKLVSKISKDSLFEKIQENYKPRAVMEYGKIIYEKMPCINSKMCIDILDKNGTIKIFGSAAKLLYGKNTENYKIDFKDFKEAIEEDSKLLLDWDKTKVSRVDFGINHHKDIDVRFLIQELRNNTSSYNSRSYGNETLNLSNTQKIFRVYDKIQEQIAKKELGYKKIIRHSIQKNLSIKQNNYKNEKLTEDEILIKKCLNKEATQEEWQIAEMKGYTTLKKDKEEIQKIEHNILREELATFKNKTIEKYFPNIQTIFEIDRSKEYFQGEKKRLRIPKDYEKKLFDLQEYFMKYGLEQTILYLGIQGIKNIDYKTFVEMFKTCNIPDRTRYRYQKKIRDLLMS